MFLWENVVFLRFSWAPDRGAISGGFSEIFVGKTVFEVGKGCFPWENVVFRWENVRFSWSLASSTDRRWEMCFLGSALASCAIRHAALRYITAAVSAENRLTQLNERDGFGIEVGCPCRQCRGDGAACEYNMRK